MMYSGWLFTQFALILIALYNWTEVIVTILIEPMPFIWLFVYAQFVQDSDRCCHCAFLLKWRMFRKVTVLEPIYHAHCKNIWWNYFGYDNFLFLSCMLLQSIWYALYSWIVRKLIWALLNIYLVLYFILKYIVYFRFVSDDTCEFWWRYICAISV